MNRSRVLSRMLAYSWGLVVVTNHFFPKYAALFNYPIHNIRLYLLLEVQTLAGGAGPLLEQLLYFSTKTTDTPAGMLPCIFVHRLEIPRGEMQTTLWPQLDSPSAAIRHEAAELLSSADCDRATHRYDFVDYLKVLRAHIANPPAGLIHYLFQHNPRAAVVIAAEVYGKDVPLPEITAKSQEELQTSLDYFAGRDEWWARLYVAITLKQNSRLPRDPELIKKVKNDEHPLVRKVFDDKPKRN